MLKPTKIFFMEHEPEALCCMPWDLAWRDRRVQSFLEMRCRTSGSQPAFSLGNAVIWNPSLEWATFRLYLERARWCHPAGELKNKLILKSERHGSSTSSPQPSFILRHKNFLESFKKRASSQSSVTVCEVNSHSGTQGSQLHWKVLQG